MSRRKGKRIEAKKGRKMGEKAVVVNKRKQDGEVLKRRKEDLEIKKER